LPPDTKLLNALRSWGCAVEVKAGAGYAAMMAPPLDSAPPVATGRLITEFVAGEFREEERPADFAKDSHSRPAAKTVSTTEIDGVVESVYTVGASAGRMFGVLSEPPANVPQTGLCILFLNAGAVRHIGPNRMWVEAARRWAARGVPSLRLDLLGIGESDGETHNDVAGLYEIGLVEQVESAMESLRARLGHQRFAAIGLCSGAFYAFHAAIRNPEIRAAVLLNPRLFFWDPEVDRRRMLRSTARGLTDWRHWRSLAQGRVRAALLKRVAEIALERMLSLWTAAGKHPQIEPTAMGRAWSALERNQCQMTMIFGGGEPLLAEMEAEGQLPPKKNPRIRCVRIPNTDHLVCPLWAQKLVHDLVDDEIDAAVHDGEPSAERRFSASGKT
jgi:pimeloyl-ACP methyl ester carboxylesterase